MSQEKFIKGFQGAWIGAVNPDGSYSKLQMPDSLHLSQGTSSSDELPYDFTPPVFTMNSNASIVEPEMQKIIAKLAEFERQISEACNGFIKRGIEPFLEYSYDNNGLPKSVTVRPRRDDDPQVGNFTLPIK